MYGYIIFTATVAMAVGCISYAGVARARMWPVGALLHADGSLPKVCGFVSALWALVKSIIEFHWWSAPVILVVGWLAALVLVFTLRKYVQWLLIPGVFITFVLTVLYTSEARPFGFLHGLVG